MSDSLWPCELQQARLLCPPLSPWVCSNACPLNQCCHPTVSTSVTHFFCPQSFPASGSFPMSQLFASHDQSTGASATASVLPINIQGWFTLGLTGFIFLQFKGFSIVFSNTTLWKHQFFGIHPSLWFHSHIHTWLLEKNISLTIWTFVDKVMSGCMNYSLNVQSASLGLSQLFFRGASIF